MPPIPLPAPVMTTDRARSMSLIAVRYSTNPAVTTRLGGDRAGHWRAAQDVATARVADPDRRDVRHGRRCRRSDHAGPPRGREALRRAADRSRETHQPGAGADHPAVRAQSGPSKPRSTQQRPRKPAWRTTWHTARTSTSKPISCWRSWPAPIRNSAAFDKVLQDLIDAVSHHVEEEESKVLPGMRTGLSAERLAELGTAFAASRKEHLGDQPEDMTRDHLLPQARTRTCPAPRRSARTN